MIDVARPYGLQRLIWHASRNLLESPCIYSLVHLCLNDWQIVPSIGQSLVGKSPQFKTCGLPA